MDTSLDIIRNGMYDIWRCVFMYKIKKIISLSTAFLLLANTMSIGIFAETQEINYNSKAEGAEATTVQSVQVDVEKAEIYSVTLPKSIVLEGDKDSPSYTYSVEVRGEISNRNYVRVIPLDGCYVETEDGFTQDLTVAQEKCKWSATEVLAGDTQTGTCTAVDLQPGKYTGTIQFFISLDDGYFYKAATCTTGKLRYAQDINDNGLLDTGEELATPVVVSKPLGHTYDGEHTFGYVCTRCQQTAYEISTPDELVAFSSAVNGGKTFANETVRVVNDIDMYTLTSVTPFTPIGTKSVPFSGTFDGCGHTIKGFAQFSKGISVYDDVNSPVTNTFGLFNCAGNGAVIKNLSLTDSNAQVTITTTNSTYASSRTLSIALLVGKTTQGITIDNCRIKNFTLAVNTNCYYASGAPFVGTVMAKDSYLNTSSDSVTINNSCVTSSTITFDATSNGNNLNSVNQCKLSGRSRYEPVLIMRNSYSDFISTYKCTKSVTLNKYITDGKSSTSLVNFICLENLPFTYTYDTTYTPTIVNCIDLTDEELKSQTGVDLLNTGYENAVWKLDLENQNDGYPIQISLS